MAYSIFDLEQWTLSALTKAGAAPEMARRAAWVFLRASERGLAHHDLSLLPQRLEWMTEGKIQAPAVPQLINRTEAIEIWDAHGGLGEAACLFALERAYEISRKAGLGFAVIRNSNHFLAGEPYVYWALERGCSALVLSNTDAGMSLPGGTARVLGNNPLAFGFPGLSPETSLSFDQCQAYTSLGSLGELSKSGQSIPEHWGRDRQGRPTRDPAAVLQEGFPEPLGGHKGVNMALMIECLTGILGGGPVLDQVRPAGGLNTHNQAVLVWNLGLLGTPQTAQRVTQMAQSMTDWGGRWPGLRSAQARRSCGSEGLKLTNSLEAELKRWAKRLTCPWPTAQGQ